MWLPSTTTATISCSPLGLGHRLHVWTGEGRHSRSYAYDTFGNLISLGGTAIAVDPATNRLAGGAVYDGRGNLVDEPMGTWTRHLRWDEDGRLLAAWGEGAGAPGGVWAFAYDHNGERVLKYRVEDGAVAEARLYLRDEQGNVLTEMAWVETDAAGYWARAKDHVYLGRDLIGTLDRATGEPQVVSYARDQLGSQRAEVWALDARTATDLWPYGAWPGPKPQAPPPPWPTAPTSSPATNGSTWTPPPPPTPYRTWTTCTPGTTASE